LFILLHVSPLLKGPVPSFKGEIWYNVFAFGILYAVLTIII